MPRRFWLVRRILLASALFLTAIVIAYAAWWIYADRALAAKVAELRAAGERMTLEDFAVEPIPDEENGAVFLIDARGATTQPTSVASFFGYIIPYADQWREYEDDIRRFVEAEAKTYALIRTARECDQANWGRPLVSPLATRHFRYEMCAPGIFEARSASRYAAIACVCEHRRGDDRAAFEHIIDMHAINRHLVAEPTDLSSICLMFATDALRCSVLTTISADLGVGDADGDAPRAAVYTLINELLSEDESRAAVIRSLELERLQFFDTATNLSRSPIRSTLSGVEYWALRPAFVLSTIRWINCTTDCIASLRNGSHASMAPRSTPLVQRLLKQTALAAWITDDERLRLMSGLHFAHHIANRRMAAIALALRLYELDHEARPDRLDALVPDYLAAVPIDPLSPTGAPLCYRPDPDHPLLYSVGENGVDDGGVDPTNDWVLEFGERTLSESEYLPEPPPELRRADGQDQPQAPTNGPPFPGNQRLAGKRIWVTQTSESVGRAWLTQRHRRHCAA